MQHALYITMGIVPILNDMMYQRAMIVAGPLGWLLKEKHKLYAHIQLPHIVWDFGKMRFQLTCEVKDFEGYGKGEGWKRVMLHSVLEIGRNG